MTLTKQIDALWNDLCGFIDSAYAKDSDANGALRDYLTKNGGWNHDLENLLDRETENEKRHRRGAPDGFRAPISAQCAAKLILCGNFLEGSRKLSAPLAVELLMFRHTAVEMGAVGWLCREMVTKEWADRVESHDYAKIMQAQKVPA